MCVSLKEKPRNSIPFDGECSDCKIDGHLEQNTWGKCAFYKAEILIAFCHEFVAWTTDRYHNVRDKPEICKIYILKPHIFHCLTLRFANCSIVLAICGFRDGTVVFSTGSVWDSPSYFCMKTWVQWATQEGVWNWIRSVSCVKPKIFYLDLFRLVIQ